jgi:hypothetical protein
LSLALVASLGCSSKASHSTSDDGELTAEDLKDGLFIHKGTYASFPPDDDFSQRKSTEIEGLAHFVCAGGSPMRDILRAERNGRTTYQRLRRTLSSEAFTTDYGPAEMPWTADAHALRESSPFVWLSIESGRFEVNQETGRRELSLGTDIMDDTYYDTKDFLLLDQQMIIRGRARWDTPTQIRRILIGAKLGTEVDSTGLKTTFKQDDRQDFATPEQIASLDHDVRVGLVKWNGSVAPSGPVRMVYEKLAADGKLHDVEKDGQTFEKVLRVEPRAYLRSTRSRFHLNESSIRGVVAVADLGPARGAEVEALLTSVEPRLAQADKDRAAKLRADIAAARDGSAIAARAKAQLEALDPVSDTSPAAILADLEAARSSKRPVTPKDLERARIVAEAASAVYHDLGKQLLDLRDAVTPETTLDDDMILSFKSWVASDAALATRLGVQPADIKRQRTLDLAKRAVEAFAALTPADRAPLLEAFAKFGAARKAANDDDFDGFAPIAEADVPALVAKIARAHVAILGRQLQVSGSARIGLWFDLARQFFVPSSFRNTGNFLIDTMDMTEMLSPESWNSIPEGERNASKPLPSDKIFRVVLVNELQIELGEEKAYVDRIKELAAKPASPERDAELAGAKLVFDKYTETLRMLSRAKGPEVIKQLERAGGKKCEVKDAETSKGELALQELRQQKGSP